jgi:hypothetical protein
MLPEEQAENSRYLFELGPARYGYCEDILDKIQALSFQGRPKRQDRGRRNTARRQGLRGDREGAGHRGRP